MKGGQSLECRATESCLGGGPRRVINKGQRIHGPQNQVKDFGSKTGNWKLVKDFKWESALF